MSEPCPSCGGAITDTFCGTCGERRPSTRGYSLTHFAHEVFETITDLDRSFLHTVTALIRRPGELTAAYMRGERVRYLRPLQLFLLVNVIFFLVGGPGVNAYSTSLHNHLNSSPYQDRARAIVRQRLPASGLTDTQYVVAFDQKEKVLARTLVIVMAPGFALAVALLSLDRRRPIVQHVVFAFHFVSFMLLLTIAIVYLLIVLAMAWNAMGGRISDYGFDQLSGLGMAVGTVIYLFLAFRRAYGDGKIPALWKAVAGFASVVAVLVAYRLFLFYVTAYTL